MRHILCFVDYDDESGIETIQELKEDVLTPEAKCHIIVKNSNKHKGQEKIEYLKSRFEAMSNDFVPISQYGNNIKEYHKLFTQLIKGEETATQVNEKKCCRI